MDTRYLESLLLVVETGSIAAAARRQNITPAALSGRIKSLEQQLNTALLSRTAHAAKPTTACKNLLPRAAAIIKQTNLLSMDIDKKGLNAPINIGCIATALTDFVPNIIRAIKQRAPAAKLHITPGSSQQLYDLLQQGKLDCAITSKPSFQLSKIITKQTIAQQPIIVLSKHVLTKPLNIELQENPLIAYDKKSWGGRFIREWTSTQKLNHTILCELDSLETIAQLVDEGLGIAILPAWYGLYKHFGHLNITPITKLGYKNDYRELLFISNQTSEITNLIKLVKLSILKEREIK